jgi:3-oxoacyl-[acyl-carrier protein] reductase
VGRSDAGTTVVIDAAAAFGSRVADAVRAEGAVTVVSDGGPVDLDDRDAVRARFAALAQAGPITSIVVVALPAVAAQPCALLDLDDAAWDAACERPLRIAVHVLEAAYEHLARSRGSIVFVCPTTGLQGAAGFVAMAALSEGLRVLAKSAARQWAVDGIAINVVAPPLRALAAADVDDAWRDATRARIPGDGTYDVDAALRAVLRFLTSVDAHHLVGVTIPVDSGQVTAL